MHHPKFSGSKCVRSAMIPAALVCVIVSACADQQPTAPELQPTASRLAGVARADNADFRRFFLAWSRGHSSNPINTQTFALDARQERQYADLWADEPVINFARANPGRLYIVGDEPDQWCIAPTQYADIYHSFVEGVRGTDPTARFSPAGFSEPNDRCCPVPADEPCRAKMHSISYAQQFYDAHVQQFGVPPRVDEWRFHDFGISYSSGDLDGWWSRVDQAAAWSVAHGAKMILGAWGFHGWRDPVPVFQEHMKQAMGRLASDDRIIGAVYWSYEPWIESPRPLVNDAGSLTAEGQTYVNPLTDVPTDVKITGSASGQAKLRWTNSTSAWAAEAEFWVQAPGSNSFAYYKTERVDGPGAMQTPVVALSIGSTVKARVRYYNAFGQADWSSFSNTVVLASSDATADQKSGLRKRPLCFLRLC